MCMVGHQRNELFIKGYGRDSFIEQVEKAKECEMI